MQEVLAELPQDLALLAVAFLGWYASKLAKEYYSVPRKTVPSFPSKQFVADWEDSNGGDALDAAPMKPSGSWWQRKASSRDKSLDAAPMKPAHGSWVQRKASHCAAVAAAVVVVAESAVHYQKSADVAATTPKMQQIQCGGADMWSSDHFFKRLLRTTYHTNQQLTIQEFLADIPFYLALFAFAVLGWFTSKWAKQYVAVPRKTVPSCPSKPSTADWEDSSRDKSLDAAPMKLAHGSWVQRKASLFAVVAAAVVAAVVAAVHYQKDVDVVGVPFKAALYDLAFDIAFFMGGAFGWSASKWVIHRFLIPRYQVPLYSSNPDMSDWEDSSTDESMDTDATEAEWAVGYGKAVDVADAAKVVAEKDEATLVDEAEDEPEPEARRETAPDQPIAEPGVSVAKPQVAADAEDLLKGQQVVAAAAAVALNSSGSGMNQLNNGVFDIGAGMNPLGSIYPNVVQNELTVASVKAAEEASAKAKGGASKRNEYEKEEKTGGFEMGNEKEAKMVLAPEVAALLDTDSEDSDDEELPFGGAATWSTPDYGYWSPSRSQPAGCHRPPPGLSLPIAGGQPLDKRGVPREEMAGSIKVPASEGCQNRVAQTLDPKTSVLLPTVSKVCQQLYTDGDQVYVMTAVPMGNLTPTVPENAVEPKKFTPVDPWDPILKAFKGLTTATAMSPNSPSVKAGPWAGQEALDDEEDDALWGVCWDFSAA